MKKLMPHNTYSNRGLTLVELMAAVLILIFLVALSVPLFTEVNNDNRLRKDVALVESVISRTMSECLSQGRVGQLVVAGGTITG